MSAAGRGALGGRAGAATAAGKQSAGGRRARDDGGSSGGSSAGPERPASELRPPARQKGQRASEAGESSQPRPAPALARAQPPPRGGPYGVRHPTGRARGWEVGSRFSRLRSSRDGLAADSKGRRLRRVLRGSLSSEEKPSCPRRGKAEAQCRTDPRSAAEAPRTFWKPAMPPARACADLQAPPLQGSPRSAERLARPAASRVRGVMCVETAGGFK